MVEGPVDCASVNDPITSGSPVVAGQTEHAPIAVNWLDCAAHNLLARLLDKAIVLHLRLGCCYFVG